MQFANELKKYNDILENKQFKKLDNFIAHGDTTVLKHCISVAVLSLAIAKIFKIKAKKKELVKSALLHDLYLYDWHKPSKRKGLHGFTHSKTAADNAKKYFNINNKEFSNIESHMWPLNITKIPKTKEGIIICIADKICSLKEIFTRKNH